MLDLVDLSNIKILHRYKTFCIWLYENEYNASFEDQNYFNPANKLLNKNDLILIKSFNLPQNDHFLSLTIVKVMDISADGVVTISKSLNYGVNP